MSITLYVNGDSHTAGTYKNYFSNTEECATALLAKKYSLNYVNRARAGGSNARIIRLSKENLAAMDPKTTVVFIGWTTFERTEWFEDGTWHQICGQPWYNVSDSLKTRWREYIAWSEDKENYYKLAIDWQNTIMDFHLWLKEQDFVHRFYHGHNCFDIEDKYKVQWPDNLWVNNAPFDPDASFTKHSKNTGHIPDEYLHFDYNAHKSYAEFLEPSLKEMLEEVKAK